MLQIISVVIFAAVMIAIISEKVHRAVAAVIGAILLLLTHILTVDSSIEYIDFNTIGVLVGMMLFVAVVKCSGIFEYIAIRAGKIAKGDPWKIMVLFIILTALFSAMLDNVTTVLLIGPMAISITKILKLDPVPFLMTLILASNIGGTATLIGDPPNIMIGSAAGFSFMDFIINTGSISVVILIALILFAKILYRKQMIVDDAAKLEIMNFDEKKAIKDPVLMKKSVVMIILVAVGFVIHGSLGLESCVIALSAAAIMMVIGRQPVEDIIADVEWPTIVFFVGLFITVGGMVETGIIGKLASMIVGMAEEYPVITMIVLLWVSALLSSILDNIPFVATLIPLITAMGDSGVDIIPFWWAISLGACLGGNGTLIGASANVVLSGISGKQGYPITFNRFLKVGFPMMLISIIISTIYLMLRFGI